VKITSSLLLIFFANLIVGCNSFPESTREMELRSEYGKLSLPETRTELPKRKKQRVEKLYMGGRLLPSGDWFVGGRLLLVINESEWIFDDAALKKNAIQ